MKRLIISESKKLWKGRKIWISVVGIVLLSVYMCFQVYYSHDELQPILYSLKNEQGKIIDVMDLIRDRDQIIHQYAGIWNQEKENLIIKDLKERLAQYPRNQLDNQAMENEYGPNYMMYLKKEETVGLNEADIEQITNEIGKVPNYLGEGENILLRRIYTNDSYRQYLSYIYTGNFMFHENFDENIFDEWNTYLISPTVEK